MSNELAEPPVATSEDAAALEAQFTASMETVKNGGDTDADKPADTQQQADKPEKTSPVDDIPDEFIRSEQSKDQAQPPEKNEFNDEPPKEVKGAAREAFKKLQQAADLKIKTLSQQLADFEKKAKESSSDAGPSKEHQEALKSASDRAAALEQELERAAYERSPRFQRFGKDEAAELTAAKSYLEGTEVSPSAIEMAARASGAQRVKILRDAGMDAETISLVGTNLARADAIRRDRDESLSNWKASREQELAGQDAARAAAEQKQRAQEDAVFKEVGEKIRGSLEGFRRIEGNAKWNALVEKNEKDAADFFAGNKSMQELAELAYQGVAATTTQMINAGLRKRLETALEENARLKAAQPGNGHASTQKPSDKAATDAEHYTAAFDSAMAQVKAG